ncbi:claspin [Sabethes cyaneus]|uniref:claspin n=1 Tax=Sabethes cyaneus TaxID=53552 RepID=UPI00237D9D40|nr:claspin [Sabethes cyaneus]
MDEDITHRTENHSQQAELNRNPEDTYANPDYNSDSELNAHDTLRMEESEDEDEHSGVKKDVGDLQTLPTEPACINSEAESNVPDKSTKKSGVIDSESEEEEELSTRRIKKLKTTKVIDSDSSDEGTTERNLSGHDSKENSVAKQNQEIDEIGAKIDQSMNRLKSLIDSDSSSPDDVRPHVVSPDEGKTRKKKLKSKKDRDASRKKKDPKDLLASLNLNFSDDEDASKSGSGTNASNQSDSYSSEDGEAVPRQRKAKFDEAESQNKSQRMSAKAAMEQMKVIQSESQRMAREAVLSIPYHRPKQHTLQEFLSRRTLQRAGNNPATIHKTTAAAIKMPPEELAIYAKQLEEREKEAIEFFKNETAEQSDENDQQSTSAPVSASASVPSPTNETITEIENVNNDQEKHSTEPACQNSGDTVLNPGTNIDTEMIDTLRVSDSEDDALDALVNKTCANAEQMLASRQAKQTPEVNKSKQPIDYEVFPDQNASSLAQRKAKLLATDTSIPLFPTLHGNMGMEIDLDSGDIHPKTPTGVNILFERFARCSGGKKEAKTTSTVNILNTDNGIVKMDTISMPLNLDDRDPYGKEPVPGAAFLKLKQTLREKIEQTRRETWLKREQEMQQCKKLDEDNEEAEDEEEILEDVDDDELDEEDEEAETDTAEKEVPCEQGKNPLIDEEAGEVDGADDDADAGSGGEAVKEYDESSDSSEEETEADLAVGREKKKSRILAAFQDSDDETEVNGADRPGESGELKKTDTEELFSTLEDSDKFTASDRKNQESGCAMALLWKDTDEPVVSATQTDDDLAALCSGRFNETQAATGITQSTKSFSSSLPLCDGPQSEEGNLSFASESNKPARDVLFTQRNEQTVDESELLALCSGTFATQNQPVSTEEPLQPAEQQSEPTSNGISRRKLVIASSDEEQKDDDSSKRKKRRRKHRNNISDDESGTSGDDVLQEDNEEVDDEENEEAGEEDNGDVNEEEQAERFVDYDSEENEVEVVMTKKDKQKVANAFLENEAELSESEWGSADEDEKDLDRYDIELADEEKFDQGQLHEELERIHARRMLEQDKKEVKTLQDMFFEDEENDGVGRERQFRWRNIETGFSLDYDKQQPEEENADDDAAANIEEEIQWRKLRYERELLLKEKQPNSEEVDLTTTLLDKSIDEEENNSTPVSTTLLLSKSRVTIVRAKKSSEPNTPKDSPFLISKTDPVQGNKASFLRRDSATLSKLASIVKVPEIEGANTVSAGKGRNFVFASVSPAVDKTGAKRSLEIENDDVPLGNKKIKTGCAGGVQESSTTKKRLLLGHLM